MKKKIELKQEDIKKIDFTKIIKVNYVDVTKERIVIEVETDGKKSD